MILRLWVTRAGGKGVSLEGAKWLLRRREAFGGGQVSVRVRSDRSEGRLRLWSSPPGRWRQHRAASAGAGPGNGLQADERGRSSSGPPSSRWPEASPRLAASGHVGRRACARTIESGVRPGGRGLRAPGAGSRALGSGWGGRACAPPIPPRGPGREVRPGGAPQDPLRPRASETGGRHSRPGPGREQRCPRPAPGALPGL